MAELTVYDGVAVQALAAHSGSSRVHAFDSVGSTMDVAHELARAGAAHGTVVLADEQRAARGRERREWLAPRGGVWLSLIARDLEPAALGVLPLRVGLGVATALDRFAVEPVGLKWPNDLLLAGRKLGGVLLEARWRGDRFDWAVIGLGINLEVPAGVVAAALGAEVRRSSVVELVVPAALDAAARSGALTADELAEFAARDVARGRVISAPIAGIAAGIDSAGSLLVETEAGMKAVRSGSMVVGPDGPLSSPSREPRVASR